MRWFQNKESSPFSFSAVCIYNSYKDIQALTSISLQPGWATSPQIIITIRSLPFVGIYPSIWISNPMPIQNVPPPSWVTGNINTCGMETLSTTLPSRGHARIAVKFAHYTNIKFCGNSLNHLAIKRPQSHEEAIPWSIYTKRRGNQVVMPLRRAYLFLI